LKLGFRLSAFIACVLLASACGLCAAEPASAPAGPVDYQNDFAGAELDKVPDEFLVLDGAFAVKQEGTNRFLELPGAPLETFGVLFGPTATNDLAVAARIFGTGKGRRLPTLGVGLNGVGGYRLYVAASKKSLELYKGDERLAGVDYAWSSGTWTELRLQIRKTREGEWKIEGKAWKHGDPEPGAWLIDYTEKTEPPSGRASVWGLPFSGTPIGFDDLVVRKLAGS
jgi:hypothetical protein